MLRMRLGSGWNRRARSDLLERLEMYLCSGTSISLALIHLSEGLKPFQQDSLKRVLKHVEAGRPLSAAMSREVGMPSAVVGLLSSGESSGNLAAMIKVSHDLLEREDELIKKCLSSMTYPVVIGLAAVALTIGLVRGVMPQIIPLLQGLHAELPLITKVVMTLSVWSMSYGGYILILAVTLTILFLLLYRRHEGSRTSFQKVLMKLPLLGKLVKEYALVLFFRSFGSLIVAGISTDTAYTKAAGAISLIPLRTELLKLGPTIAQGESVAKVFRSGMPSFVAAITSAGEASGNLGTSLVRVAEILDRELDHSLKRLTALIEPLMMIVMGGAVGSIALSIMMPIYDISKTLQH